MCLTETCLVERDPATYNVVTCKPLCDVSTCNYLINSINYLIICLCSFVILFIPPKRDHLSYPTNVHNVLLDYTHLPHDVDVAHILHFLNPPVRMQAGRLMSTSSCIFLIY